jgi:hypothetical protein
MSDAWQALVSALIGIAVLAITTLGPKLISAAADWLTAHDKGGQQQQASTEATT